MKALNQSTLVLVAIAAIAQSALASNETPGKSTEVAGWETAVKDVERFGGPLIDADVTWLVKGNHDQGVLDAVEREVRRHLPTLATRLDRVPLRGVVLITPKNADLASSERALPAGTSQSARPTLARLAHSVILPAIGGGGSASIAAHLSGAEVPESLNTQVTKLFDTHEAKVRYGYHAGDQPMLSVSRKPRTKLLSKGVSEVTGYDPHPEFTLIFNTMSICGLHETDEIEVKRNPRDNDKTPQRPFWASRKKTRGPAEVGAAWEFGASLGKMAYRAGSLSQLKQHVRGGRPLNQTRHGVANGRRTQTHNGI